MLHEDLRYIHEDIERLEQAITDRALDEPKHIRNRLLRDHTVASLLSRIQTQSQNALRIYNDQQQARTLEIQSISTGDPFEEFYKQLNSAKSFHKRYPNEPVENLERTYKKPEDGGPGFVGDIDGLFTGEEAFGRFFDLTMLHEEFLNLPGIRNARKLTYLQYLDTFDVFTQPQCPLYHKDKMTDEYFSYVGSLAQYLEGFLRRIKPLEDLDVLFATFDKEFETFWADGKLPGWGNETQANGGSLNDPVTEGTGEGIWCSDCAKEFKNKNIYKAHLTGKKHLKNASQRQQCTSAAKDGANTEIPAEQVGLSVQRLKEKAIAEREYRVRKFTSTMSTEREDTRVNVERKAGMTDRERQQELAALYAEDADADGRAGTQEDAEQDGDEKIYNPLKLPLAWDGKPIPFWLYKLHGLGVEFSCQICGNYVYMGRRAFEKHFTEARHIYGLKCLGITSTGLFREITQIEEAEKLWEKICREKRAKEEKGVGVVEMEDTEGNVMPEKVYEDLKKQGLL